MFKFDFEIDDIDEELSSVLPESTQNPTLKTDSADDQPTLAPSIEHPIQHLLDALPPLISYSPLAIPIPNRKYPVHLVRRDLFDARFQLIADGTIDPDAARPTEDEEQADGVAAGAKNAAAATATATMDPSILEYLDAPSDLLPGVYEGGLKTWECSLDLVEHLETSGPFKSYAGKRVLELGCGTAIPSLYVLLKALSEPPTSKETHIHLQDYNASVLELVTFPNVLLTWYLSPASQAYRTSSPETETDDPPQPIIPTDPGELPITPALTSAFLASLQSHNIHLRFFSGAWDSFDLSPPPKGSGGSYNLLLTSETIYRQESLPSLIRLLDEGSAGSRSGRKRRASGDLDLLTVEKLTIGEPAEACASVTAPSEEEKEEKEEDDYLCLVAAKVLYFGVGGGISDFVGMVQAEEEQQEQQRRVGAVTTVLERTAGIGRKVLRVEWR